MAGFTGNFPGIHVLGMAEEDMFLHIVNPDPFNGFTCFLCAEDFIDFKFA